MLIIECGTPGIMDSVVNWLDLEGADFAGTPIAASSNFDFATFQTVSCAEDTDVTFTVNDTNCGRMITCNSTIRVQDNLRPNITCPPNRTIDTTDPNAAAEIALWQSEVSFDDNGCSTPSLFMDPELDNLDFCTSTAPITVTFTAVDMCNLESGCVSIISFNDSEPDISCPGMVLSLECGDVDNLNMVQSWIAETTAADNAGNDLSLTIDNDFSTTLLDTCTQDITVVFNVTDVCGKETFCQNEIRLRDTQAPVPDCPGTPLNLLAGDTVKIPKFINWLELIPVDECGGYEITHDFDESQIEGFNCDEEDFNFTASFTDAVSYTHLTLPTTPYV